MQANCASLGVWSDGGRLSWRERAGSGVIPKSVHRQTVQLGHLAQMCNRRKRSGWREEASVSCETIHVQEDKSAGHAELKAEKQTVAVGAGLSKAGWADPHVVWRCLVHFNQAQCSTVASGVSSCHSSHWPELSKHPLHCQLSWPFPETLTFPAAHKSRISAWRSWWPAGCCSALCLACFLIGWFLC